MHRHIDCVWLVTVFILLLLLHSRFISATPVLQVQLYEHRISENNDTSYVRQIMRLAKSAEMRNYMRPEVDVCDNFYEYACGNWPKIHPAGSVNPRQTNIFELLTHTYNQKQLRLLQEDVQKGDSVAEKIVKKFYAACHRLSPTTSGPYKAKLKQIIAEFGEMPALVPNDNWQPDKFDWLTTIAQIQNRYGFDIILQLGIRMDFENKTLNKLFIGQPSLRLQTKSMYTSEDTKWHRERYRQEIQENLQLHLDVDKQRALLVSNEILAFEVQLAHGIIDRKLGKTLKELTVPRTLDELQAVYAPNIDFKKFLSISLGHEINATFYEYMLDYQVNLVEILKVTPIRQFANYIFYQLVESFIYKYTESNTVREKLCLDKTKMYFAKMLDNIIYRKYNNKGTQRDINLIWEKLQETFKAELESDKVGWMSLITRKLAIEKLQSTNLEINSYENSNFTEEFAQLNISDSDFLDNIKQIRAFETKRALDSLYQLPKPIDAGVMLSYSPAYIATENVIKIPVSLLQPNYLWSDHYPNAVKFGTLGYLVAHELIHGFDDIGRNYDINGLERTWWDTDSTEAFNERKNCFKRQYARFRYGGKYLPESELQAENIADNGAIQVAFSAYLNWSSSVGEEVDQLQTLQAELLPHMSYTSKQLFFLSFAQFWCNDVNEHYKEQLSINDLHAPGMFRVIGPLANFDAFSKEFKCARGTTMNPPQKCQIY